ncbi:unnamed protein product [Caenorhabditis auriculariae]|uniref:SH3 domain-containing protein n=1 Tax=Caenorhabditis auriculariae TaxID=2777116 RepID=A0A8S1HPI4_9PELO|nr:unnamed protein product [Caenorhabditis auriculariae]
MLQEEEKREDRDAGVRVVARRVDTRERRTPRRRLQRRRQPSTQTRPQQSAYTATTWHRVDVAVVVVVVVVAVRPGPPQGPSTSAAYSATNHLGPTSAPSSDSLLLTLRAKPHARVFRALFQYLPLRDSPNENPQLELSLQPGDVILVKGEMDTDGFYRGETLDGRTGLVPSNYVERVPDSVLLANARAPSPSFPLHVPQHLAAIQHDFSSPDHSTLPDSVCPYPPADVTKVTVQEIKNNETPREKIAARCDGAQKPPGRLRVGEADVAKTRDIKTKSHASDIDFAAKKHYILPVVEAPEALFRAAALT